MEIFPSIWGISLDLWHAEHEGPEGLRRRQNGRFAALLAHARGASRFYRRLYQHLPADGVKLHDLPVVTKPELMEAFDDWVTDPRITRADVERFTEDPSLIAKPYRDDYFVCMSSGTTGIPGLFIYDPDAINMYRAIAFARIEHTWLGASDWLHMAQRGFRWAGVFGTGAHYVGAGWIELERQRDAFRAGAFRVFSVQQPLNELVADLNSFDPAMLTGYPSALELLADEQIAGRLELRPALLECGGETLSQESAERITSAFGCTLRNIYSASECLTMAFSCDQNWLHVNSDWVILEPVNEDHRPTAPGEPSHTVLLTNLANRVQPIIRYDLGDSVLVRPDRCPCGSPLPGIRVAGRNDDILRLLGVDGNILKVLPLAIGTVIEETPGIHRSQLIQTGPDTIRLRLDIKDGADSETVWKEATERLKAYLVTQRLANVALLRASEPPEQSARFGKFRQVLVDPMIAGQR